MRKSNMTGAPITAGRARLTGMPGLLKAAIKWATDGGNAWQQSVHKMALEARHKTLSGDLDAFML